MIDWLEIDKATIFKGNDENGNRYLTSFLSDYKKTFNPPEINAGCDRCLNEYYEKLTKHLSTMEKDAKKSEYVLKAKYNGIPLKFGSPVLVTNQNMTDEYAKTLLKNHQKGAELFEKIPENHDEGNEDVFKGMKRTELDALATNLGLVPADYANMELIKEAIIAKQKEINDANATLE